MTSDPLIDIIAKQSKARLDEMEAGLQAQLERTRFELDLVRQAKALKRPPGRQPVLDPVRPPRRGNGRSSKREPIRRLMQTEPNRAWRPPEVSRALAEQGIAITRDGARVTMNRMVEEDELEKLTDGSGYRLANGSTSHTASPAAAATANGENREMRLSEGTPRTAEGAG